MRNNPQVPMIEYVKWVLECWDINFEDFDDSIIEPENICKIINDLDFDEELMMLDVTINRIWFRTACFERTYR